MIEIDLRLVWLRTAIPFFNVHLFVLYYYTLPALEHAHHCKMS